MIRIGATMGQLSALSDMVAFGPQGPTGGGGGAASLLLESASYLLQEDGSSHLLLE